MKRMILFVLMFVCSGFFVGTASAKSLDREFYASSNLRTSLIPNSTRVELKKGETCLTALVRSKINPLLLVDGLVDGVPAGNISPADYARKNIGTVITFPQGASLDWDTFDRFAILKSQQVKYFLNRDWKPSNRLQTHYAGIIGLRGQGNQVTVVSPTVGIKFESNSNNKKDISRSTLPANSNKRSEKNTSPVTTNMVVKLGADKKPELKKEKDSDSNLAKKSTEGMKESVKTEKKNSEVAIKEKPVEALKKSQESQGTKPNVVCGNIDKMKAVLTVFSGQETSLIVLPDIEELGCYRIILSGFPKVSRASFTNFYQEKVNSASTVGTIHQAPGRMDTLLLKVFQPGEFEVVVVAKDRPVLKFRVKVKAKAQQL